MGLVLAPKERTSEKTVQKTYQTKLVREHFLYLHKLFVLFGLGVISKCIVLEWLY